MEDEGLLRFCIFSKEPVGVELRGWLWAGQDQGWIPSFSGQRSGPASKPGPPPRGSSVVWGSVTQGPPSEQELTERGKLPQCRWPGVVPAGLCFHRCPLFPELAHHTVGVA